LAEAVLRDARDEADHVGTPTSPYERWKKSEGLPTIQAFHLEDVHALELSPWSSRGGKGAFVGLDGTDGDADACIYELGPGEASVPIRHIYEETTFILSGRGATSIWTDSGNKQAVQWQEGTFFALPPNAWYQHRNLSDSEPTRCFAMTTAPKAINTFDDLDFVFNNSHPLTGRFDDRVDYFQEAPPPGSGVWRTNYMRDVLSHWPTQEGRRGRGTLNVAMPSCRSLTAQITYGRPPGNYTRIHRHGPGINTVTLVLEGNGYSWMWPHGGTPTRNNFAPGSMFLPPELWWHGHFNVGPQPWTSILVLWGREKPEPGEGGDHIEVDDEDPAMHAEFDAELQAAGVACTMRDHPYCTQK
jgi:mannose-6-phosphate isomerase-like protein (cupin superfamily)